MRGRGLLTDEQEKDLLAKVVLRERLTDKALAHALGLSEKSLRRVLVRLREKYKNATSSDHSTDPIPRFTPNWGYTILPLDSCKCYGDTDTRPQWINQPLTVGEAVSMAGEVAMVAPWLRGAGVVGEVGGAGRIAEGSFSIIDWSGYPAGLTRPVGPFRILTGEEYAAARALADKTNAAIRAKYGLEGSGFQIHEIQPVKFGGSPTDLSNKVLLPAAEHVGKEGVHAQFWSPLLKWATDGGF